MSVDDGLRDALADTDEDGRGEGIQQPTGTGQRPRQGDVEWGGPRPHVAARGKLRRAWRSASTQRSR